MADFTLVIGNKNYSSWSLRGWLMAKAAGIEFDEIVVPLDLPETQPTIRKHSPSGRVPVLLHRGLAVWESLAIGEYLNDIKHANVFRQSFERETTAHAAVTV